MSQRAVLDNGYVKLIDIWGDDRRIIEAARMSTNKGFLGWGPLYKCECRTYTQDEYRPFCTDGCAEVVVLGSQEGDEKLLRFLWVNQHLTPFEQCGLTIETQVPIFVVREWHRHRTQSYNEMSGRYTILPDLYYIPSIERIMNAKQSTTNRQGSDEGISEEAAELYREILRESSEQARSTYLQLLEAGVAREVARIVLPVNQYTRMRASANLRNWLAFLKLRMANNAQWEIRQYANIIANLVEEQFPRTYALFKEGLND